MSTITTKEALLKVSKQISGLSDKVEEKVKEDLMYQRLEEQFRGKGFLEKLEGIFKIITA